jgi:pilus assembly protein CpaE
MLDSMMLRHSTGLRVLSAPQALLPVDAYTPHGLETIIGLARRRFGHVVIDLPVSIAAWTGTVLRSASAVYLVTSLSIPAAHRQMKFLQLLNEENMRDLPLKVIANRCQRSKRNGNDVSVAQFEKATNRKIDYFIPNDYSLISLSHVRGKPAVKLSPNSAFSNALVEMLAKDLGTPKHERKRRGNKHEQLERTRHDRA